MSFLTPKFLLKHVPGSTVFRWADVLIILHLGAAIHFVATGAFWLPVVAAGCATF